MALITCPECGKEISDKAQSCPNCGYVLTENVPKEKPTVPNRPYEALIGFSVLVEIICFYFIKELKTSMGFKKALNYFDNNLAEIIRPYKIGITVLIVVAIIFAYILIVNILGLIKKKKAQ